jgi:hypothetical protein
MSDANERQVGGDHYKGADYQHWDFVTDARLDYLPAQATRYISRWRRHPDGAENLEKALHYIDKCEEMHSVGAQSPHWLILLNKYTTANKTDATDKAAMHWVCLGNWAEACRVVRDLLNKAS